MAFAVTTKFGGGTAVTCGTTATALDDTSIPYTEPRWIVVSNPSSNVPIYIAGAGVTATTGTMLRPGETYFAGCVASGTKLYCITASGTAQVSVVEGFGCGR